MLMGRVRAWFDSTEGDLVTVSHGGVIRVLWHLLENRPKETVTEDEVMQDKVYVFSNGAPALI